MYKSIPTSVPFQPHCHSLNCYSRVVQVTRLETTCGSKSPLLFVILVTLSHTFPYTFPGHTFLNTPLSLSQTSNTSSVPPEKENKSSVWLSSFYLGTHRRCVLWHIFPPYYCSIQKLLYTSKTTKFTAKTLMPNTLHRINK